jgi:hypothetical protein
MGGRNDSGRRRIDGAVKARFVEALRAGVTRDEAAAAQGFSASSFYLARWRDPLFKAAWVWALELSAVDQRDARRAEAQGAAAAGHDIQPNNQRLLQRRRPRGIKFTDTRKQAFLDHFAGTADVQASCDAAGVHYSTVYKHHKRDAVFAAGWDEALGHAYALLEAETVRQRLEAQRRQAFEPNPTGDIAREFERVMQLLTRLDKQGGRGIRQVKPGRQRQISFDEAIEELDRKLTAFGVREGVAPREAEEP